jgi:hypothetical protein
MNSILVGTYVVEACVGLSVISSVFPTGVSKWEKASHKVEPHLRNVRSGGLWPFMDYLEEQT